MRRAQHHDEPRIPGGYTLVQSTGGRSDSAIYFAIVLQYLGYGYELEEALAQAVRELRAHTRIPATTA